MHCIMILCIILFNNGLMQVAHSTSGFGWSLSTEIKKTTKNTCRCRTCLHLTKKLSFCGINNTLIHAETSAEHWRFQSCQVTRPGDTSGGGAMSQPSSRACPGLKPPLLQKPLLYVLAVRGTRAYMPRLASHTDREDRSLYEGQQLLAE